jgi:hypothetical protein
MRVCTSIKKQKRIEIGLIFGEKGEATNFWSPSLVTIIKSATRRIRSVRIRTVTGDEDWFLFEYLQDRLWMSSPEIALEYSNKIIATEKHMFIVFWNPDVFNIVMIVLEKASFSAPWFVDGNFVPLRDKFFPGKRGPTGRN